MASPNVFGNLPSEFGAIACTMSSKVIMSAGFCSMQRLTISLTWNIKDIDTYTMRTNSLNWCNLISISKKVVSYTFFGGKNLLNTSVYLQNINCSNVFGKFVLIVYHIPTYNESKIKSEPVEYSILNLELLQPCKFFVKFIKDHLIIIYGVKGIQWTAVHKIAIFPYVMYRQCHYVDRRWFKNAPKLP